MILEDGTGGGFAARIDNRKDLHVNSRTRQRYQVRTGEGFMFIMSMPMLTVTPSTTGRMFWFRFEEPDLQFHVHRLLMSYNGGSTTGNKTTYAHAYVGDSVPSANEVESAGINALLGNLNTFEHSFYYWDGVGTGMTIGTPGALAPGVQIEKGTTDLTYEGTIVLGPQQILSFNAIPEEEGTVTITMYGYLINPVEED